MRRYNSFGLKKYNDKCQLIDSTNIFNGYYKLIMPKMKDEKILNNGLRKNFLVLYHNGKIAKFLDYKEDSFDFNPKKAEMGFFGKVNGKCYMKFKIETLGGHKIIEDEVVYIDKDSLIVYTKKSPTSIGFFSKYEKVYYKNLNIGKTPDW